MRTGLLLLTLLATTRAPAQMRAAFRPMPPAEADVRGVGLRTAGAVGGMVVAAYGTFLILYGGNEPDVPPVLLLAIPVGGAAGGAYLVGRATDAPGSFSGAVVGTLIGMVPGTVVLAAAGSSTDAETVGGLLFVGGAAVGAAVGYGSRRLSLGLMRAPGGVMPALRARF